MKPVSAKWLLWLALAGGCGALPGGHSPYPGIERHLGVYRGSFDSALTPDPADDLNYNPCEPGREETCLTHHAPLADILLELTRDRSGKVRLAFFRTEEDLASGRPLDLLGRGCGTRLDTAAALETTPDGRVIATFPLATRNQLCRGKLRPTSRHHLTVELGPDAAERPHEARVVIDKNVRDANYLYVVEDGVRKRVRIDRSNTLRDANGDRYRVCIEDELGEQERCVLTDREFRSFALPVPVPGGVGINYTWWQELRPRLRSTRDRYELERYVGRFERAGS